LEEKETEGRRMKEDEKDDKTLMLCARHFSAGFEEGRMNFYKSSF
jgi:hypothetical protein